MAIYLLYSGPLGLLAHNRPAQRIPIQTWLVQAITASDTFYISEFADYEVRRELTRLIRTGQMPASRLTRLDQLVSLCSYLPVSTAMWRRGADLWAEARQQGLPTAGMAALDADVLIAAQAMEASATVVTNNPVHLGRWAPVLVWP